MKSLFALVILFGSAAYASGPACPPNSTHPGCPQPRPPARVCPAGYYLFCHNGLAPDCTCRRVPEHMLFEASDDEIPSLSLEDLETVQH